MKKYDKELYFNMFTLWDNEISRFYTRQNLYIGIQLSAFAGSLLIIEKLISNHFLLVFVGAIILFTSFITALITTRGYYTQKRSLKILLEIEKRSEGNLDILELGKKVQKTNYLTNFIISLVFSWGLFFAWIIFFIAISFNKW